MSRPPATIATTPPEVGAGISVWGGRSGHASRLPAAGLRLCGGSMRPLGVRRAPLGGGQPNTALRTAAAMNARMSTASAAASALTQRRARHRHAAGRRRPAQQLARRLGARGGHEDVARARGEEVRHVEAAGSGASATGRPPRAASPAAARPRPGCARTRRASAPPRRTAGAPCGRARAPEVTPQRLGIRVDERDAAARRRTARRAPRAPFAQEGHTSGATVSPGPRARPRRPGRPRSARRARPPRRPTRARRSRTAPRDRRRG